MVFANGGAFRKTVKPRLGHYYAQIVRHLDIPVKIAVMTGYIQNADGKTTHP